MKLLISLLTIFITSCVPPSSGESGSSPLIAALPFVLIFVFFYLLILRPQRKQSKERDELLGSLKRGDDIITSGGIYGKIINVEDNKITLEIAKGTNISIDRSGISGKVNQESKKSKQENKNSGSKGGN